jgi:N-acetylglutamate synthase-like GNAT family acetyltransferase
VFHIRSATQGDQSGIRELIRAVRINPTGLDWRRFVVALDDADGLIGCGQVKPHRDGSRELSSVAVVEKWRGRGVARALIDRLLAENDPPLWLTCRSSLAPLYKRFGFREVQNHERQPPYFRRLRRLAKAFKMLSTAEEHLAVMVWGDRSGDGASGQG